MPAIRYTRPVLALSAATAAALITSGAAGATPTGSSPDLAQAAADTITVGHRGGGLVERRAGDFTVDLGDVHSGDTAFVTMAIAPQETIGALPGDWKLVTSPTTNNQMRQVSVSNRYAPGEDTSPTFRKGEAAVAYSFVVIDGLADPYLPKGQTVDNVSGVFIKSITSKSRPGVTGGAFLGLAAHRNQTTLFGEGNLQNSEAEDVGTSVLFRAAKDTSRQKMSAGSTRPTDLGLTFLALAPE
jgi:hypothetical protein